MDLKKNIKAFIRLLQKRKIIKANITLLEANQRLEGKKIVITGGTRGLGYAMAKKFIEEGAEVLITGRNKDNLEKAAKTIGCKYIQYDVTDFARLDSFVEQADKMLDGANVLVNNAGISLHEGTIRNVSYEQFDKQINTNLKGAYFLSQKFLCLYEKKHRTNGSILFLSSERGQYVDDLPYGIIKAAINSLTQGLAKMLIRNNIRINAIAPGITATDMTGVTKSDLYADDYSTGRFYLPEEVAEIACFLICDASNCLSGQIIVCNNGNSINYRE